MTDFPQRFEGLSRFPWRPLGWTVVAGLLLLPLVAMQFTDEVDWSGGDFLAAALLLGGTGLLIEVAVRQSQDLAYRLASAGALLTALLLLWVNLAVGVIGAEDNPANAWYLAIYVVGILGAAVSRLRAKGLAVTMAAMALTQAGITALAIARDAGGEWAGPAELLFANGFFIVLWGISAVLFALAAMSRTSTRGRI
jgi:hypothetical protein